MARMSFSGTDDIMADLFAESERLERKAAEMLDAGSEVVVDAWKEAITEAGHAPPGKSKRATGELLNSVRPGKIKKKGEAYIREIYPQGRDRKKQRLAEIAFVLHYGTSKMPGDHFVDAAEEKAEEAANRAMEEVWNRD